MSLLNIFKRGQRDVGPTSAVRPQLKRRQFIDLYGSIITEAIRDARDQRAVTINFSKASKRAHEIYAMQASSGRPGSAVEAIQVAIGEMSGDPFRPRGSQPVPSAMALVPYTGSATREIESMATLRKPSKAVWARYFKREGAAPATAADKAAVKAYLAAKREASAGSPSKKKTSSRKAAPKKAGSRKAAPKKAGSRKASSAGRISKASIPWKKPRGEWTAAERKRFGEYMQQQRSAKSPAPASKAKSGSRKSGSRKVGSRKSSPKRSFSGGRKSNATLGPVQKRATRKPSQVSCATNAGKNAAVKALRADKAELEGLVGRSSLDSLYYIAQALVVGKKATAPNKALLTKAIKAKKGSVANLFGTGSRKPTTRKSAPKKATTRKSAPKKSAPKKATTRKSAGTKKKAAPTRKAATTRKSTPRKAAGSRFKVTGTVDVSPA